jgi:uncharacterized RDD family membrane protein YckC
MSERPNDPGITSGDPLAPGPEAPRHESGLPGFSGGYSSPPPPGAFGGAPVVTAPGPVAGRYVLAGWWSRVGAAIIDGIIIGIVGVILLAIFGLGFASSDDSDTGFGALIVASIVSTIAFAVAALLYAPLMMAKTNGKTVGRMAVGNRVVRANGAPMSFGWAMLREVAVKILLVGVLNSVTFGLAGLLDVLWPLWDDENRALHDFVVDTRTVKD